MSSRMFGEILQRGAELVANDPEVAMVALSEPALEKLRVAGTSSIRMLETLCDAYATRRCLATIPEDGRPEAELTYRELWENVRQLATAMGRHGLARRGEAIALLGWGSIDWVLVDLACLYGGCVSVPLQTNLSTADLRHIIGDANARTLVCSYRQWELLGPLLGECPTVREVVVMDGEPTEAERAALVDAHGIAVVTVARLLADDTGDHAPMVVPGENGVPEDALELLLYTSGSTGTPKGAMCTAPVNLARWRRALDADIPMFPRIGLSYLPLNHLAGRTNLVYAFVRGGTLYFARTTDLSSWFEDVQRVRPTSLTLVPRVSEMIHHLHRSGATNDAALLGDRLLVLFTATAPTDPDVSRFIGERFGVPVIDVYGATENGDVTINRRLAKGSVTDFKLVDVPELGYTGRDEPFPRGELYVKTRTLIPGYLNDPALTSELLDSDGFMKTGDIVEQRGSELVWVDRTKAVIKLSQGEFVNVSRLEQSYVASSPLLRQVYLYGNSRRAYLLAVVVPAQGAVHGDDEARRAVIRRELGRVAGECGLRSYEVPRDVLLSEPFTPENGLLTESGKPSRPRLRQRFGDALEALYNVIEAHEAGDLAPDGTPLARLKRAVSIALGIDELDMHQSFVGLGGDSVGALRLRRLIHAATGVDVPASALLSPAMTLARIAELLDGALEENETPLFARIHPKGAGVEASELTLEAFGLEPPLTLSSTTSKDLGWVLLTGANGFLGQSILDELLDRSDIAGVACLVRAANDADAASRLLAALPETARARASLALSAARLRVYAGDLVRPRLGLHEAHFDELGGDVRCVVHNGALVNHALSYLDLFEPNVLGTAEVVRFAMHRRAKSIVFVSSVSVGSGLGAGKTVPESASASLLWPTRPASGGYAWGYGTSKWASEVLLERAASAGIPVTIVRSSMVLGDRRRTGHINVDDLFTRLVTSIVHTRLLPASFYLAEGGGYFDGVPVDVVARKIAIATTADRSDRPGLEIVHATNPHSRSRVDLDVLSTWVESCGYPLERVGSYDEWYRRFTEALRGLAEPIRCHSLLPLLGYFERPIDARATLHFESSFSEEDAPPLTPAYIATCVEHLRHRGLLPAADRAG